MEKDKKNRICSRCGTKCVHECPVCRKNFSKRKNAEYMTGEERVQEMRSWAICEIDPELVHKRIEELVGRPVNFFIEVANNWPDLVEEARFRNHPQNMAQYLMELDTEHKIEDVVLT